MFGPRPFKDAEKNPEPPKLDFRDRLELVFGFFFFHHKLIIAVLLIAGLGYWLHWVNNIDPADKMRTGDEPRISQLKPEEIKLPPDLELTSLAERDAEKEESVKDPAEKDAAVAADDPDLLLNGMSLKTAKIDDLIDYSLDITNRWKLSTPQDGFDLVMDRAKVAQHLIASKELDSGQREFALVSYINSIGILDSLNVENSFKVTGTHKAVVEVGQLYSDHRNPNVAAQANLLMVMAPGYSFILNGDKAILDELEKEVSNRLTKIEAHVPSVIQLIRVAWLVHKNNDNGPETHRICKNMFEELEKSSNKHIACIGDAASVRLFFEGYETSDLIDALNAKDPDVERNLNKIFEVLEVEANTALSCYGIILLAAKTVLDNGDIEQATTWIDRLEPLVAKVTNGNVRSNFEQQIASLRQTIVVKKREKQTKK